MPASTRKSPSPRPSAAKASAPRWERKAEERPEALFEAALRVFSARGYRATRLEEVAEAAGVSKGTIYRYFRNKEDLIEKTLDHRRKHMIPAVEAALAAFEGTSAEKLRFFLDRCWHKCMTSEWGSFHRLIFGEIAHELPALFEKWARQSVVGAAWRILEGILREGQKRGEFRADADVKSVARFLYSGLSHQAMLRAHMGFDKFDPMAHDRILATSFDLTLRGLRPEAPTRPSAGKKS
jgi:AcrR family transcriptional regulator